MLGVSADDKHCVTVVTVRWSSAVDSTIELACTGVAHKATAALSGLLWPLWAAARQRHGRWCRIRAPSSGRRSVARVRPVRSFLSFCAAPSVRKCATYSHNEPTTLRYTDKVVYSTAHTNTPHIQICSTFWSIGSFSTDRFEDKVQLARRVSAIERCFSGSGSAVLTILGSAVA